MSTRSFVAAAGLSFAAGLAAVSAAKAAKVERSGEAVRYEIDVATDQGETDVDVDATGKATMD